jgi:hypothetical protein
MSEVALFKGGLPSYLKNVQDDTTKALAGSDGGGAKRISIKGSVFRMMSGGKEVAVNEDRAMNIIIIKAAPNVARTYYGGVYVEGEVTAPKCWSSNGLKPDADANERQSESCANCPQNAKGSGQGESRACRYSQNLAVLLENDTQGDIFRLTLPATSIFGEGETNKMPLQRYAKHLQAHGVPVSGVVTEMRFDTASPTPKLIFKPVRHVSEQEFDAINERKDSPEAEAAIKLSLGKADTAKKPALIAAPVVAAPAVEPEEPKKVTKKPAENATDLAALVNEFDDE